MTSADLGGEAPVAVPGAERTAFVARRWSASGEEVAAARRLLLAGAGRPELDGIARLAARLLGSRSAQVSLLTEVQTVAGGAGLPPDVMGSQIALAESLCTVTATCGRPLIVPDAHTDERVSGLPPVASGVIRSYLGVPLVTDAGHTVGALCVFDASPHSWAKEDVALLEQLAASVAAELELAALAGEFETNRVQWELVALDNARLYAEQRSTSQQLREANERLETVAARDRTVARALQDAMLTRLPEPDHLHLVARYLTATGTEQVGGDWYDAIVSPTGETTLMIGDVAGHDITAAGVMGQLRNMLRAFAWDHAHDPPSAIVTRLDRAMHDLRMDTLATVTVGRIEQHYPDREHGLRTLHWANAGHPPPILVDPAGSPRALEVSYDILLGVAPDTVRRDHLCSVPPGSTLLLYTDGLIETRTDTIDAGQNRLLTALRTHHHLAPDELIDAVITDMVGSQPDDDVAVMAVRFHSEDAARPAEAGPRHT